MASFVSISMEEAKSIFQTKGDYLILDVRHQEEYEKGHIPNALLWDNDLIGTERSDLLPDLQQRIYVYCRSGRRSKMAAEKLCQQGYTNLVEFGGILDWTGEIE